MELIIKQSSSTPVTSFFLGRNILFSSFLRYICTHPVRPRYLLEDRGKTPSLIIVVGMQMVLLENNSTQTSINFNLKW
jgi:hypothetical protein